MSRTGGVKNNYDKRCPGVRAASNQALDEHIREVFNQHKGRYGSPRIELNDRDPCSEIEARRMQTLALQAVQAKKFKVTTDSEHDKPVAPDLLQQDFSAEEANRKWVRHHLYLDQGWMYLAVVMDLYSRAITDELNSWCAML